MNSQVTVSQFVPFCLFTCILLFSSLPLEQSLRFPCFIALCNIFPCPHLPVTHTTPPHHQSMHPILYASHLISKQREECERQEKRALKRKSSLVGEDMDHIPSHSFILLILPNSLPSDPCGSAEGTSWELQSSL